MYKDFSLTERGKTIKELAEEKYPGQTYDFALPLDWVNRMRSRGLEPVGHFVSLYPNNLPGFSFYMAPITDEGIRMAAIIATHSA
jgi:hypothetical protein